MIAVVRCLVAAMLFGAATPAAKALLDAMEPQLLAGFLYLGAALAVLPLAIRRPSGDLRSNPKNVARLVGAVGSGGVVAPLLLLAGLAQAPAASVSLWLTLETVATAFIAWGLFREHLAPRAWVAVTVVTLAAAVVVAPAGGETWRAVPLVALACLFWGLDNNLTALIEGFTPAQYTAVKGIVAGAFNAVVAASIGTSWPGIGPVVSALAAGALCYGVSLALYVASSQEIGAARAQMVFATSPFFGGMIAWFILGESLSAGQAAGALLMGVGIVLLFSDSHAHLHAHESVTHTHSHRHDDGHHEHAHGDIAPSTQHTHPHTHRAVTHAHPHFPDLHHRHRH